MYAKRSIVLLTLVLFSTGDLQQKKNNIAADSVGVHQFVRQKRIIGGVPVTDDRYPWAVSLQLNMETGFWYYFTPTYTHICGGSLIHSQWILTAAHCFEWFNDTNSWHARLGYRTLNRTFGDIVQGWYSRLYNYAFGHSVLEPYYRVKRIILYPVSHERGAPRDVALVQLQDPIPRKVIPNYAQLMTVQSGFYKDWPPYEQECTAIGWGCQQRDGSETPDLQAVNLFVYPRLLCSSFYFPLGYLFDKGVFCAGREGMIKGICLGDSGGALVCPAANGSDLVAGILIKTSVSDPGKYPAILNRVAYFNDWIKEELRTRTD